MIEGESSSSKSPVDMDSNSQESSSTRMEQAIRSSWDKIVAKNAELGGELVVAFGRR